MGRTGPGRKKWPLDWCQERATEGYLTADTQELERSDQCLIDQNAFYQLNDSGVASSVIVLLRTWKEFGSQSFDL